MKVTSTILVLTLATASSFAQNAKPATQPPTPAAKPASAAPAKPAATTLAPATKPATGAAAAKPVAEVKPAAPAKKHGASKKAKAAKPAKSAPQAKTSTAQPEANQPNEAQQKVAKAIAANGKRDPFVTPIVNKIGGPTNCTTGKKCLMPDQIRLQGIVRSHKGMIAMVINAANKTYFLYENDPVYNGYVAKITADSIVFKETVQDRLGKPMTREVVKKVNTPAV